MPFSQQDSRFREVYRFGLAGPVRGIGVGAAFIWLLFLVFPLVNAITTRAPALRLALAIVGALVFVAAYVALVLIWRRRQGEPIVGVLFATLLVVATALTVAERPGWGFLFTYCAACAALISPAPAGFFGVIACTALSGVTSAIGGANGGSVIGFVATTAGIGLLMLLMRDLRERNWELSEARAELARVAVVEERERFARDLHDLIGHSLSVIALKAELAGRLLPARPEEAASEIADVEGVARQALGEVRDAVSGYRQPTLDGELEGARMALSAAGISASVERSQVPLDPAVEAVLAWAVREGATNVIRHSAAKHVEVRVSTSLADASVEVIDDGVGGAASNGHRGNGLAGLAERAERLRGRIDAAPCPDGGFRLAVTVPVSSP
jgi:two-component system sensor histidine kinase DesK